MARNVMGSATASGYDVTIVVPAYNEEACIDELARRLDEVFLRLTGERSGAEGSRGRRRRQREVPA